MTDSPLTPRPSRATGACVERVDTAVYRAPLDAPESDGTLTWDETTVVTATAQAAGHQGLGFTYGSPACATVIDEHLAGVVVGANALDPPAAWEAMVRAIRNHGRPGIVSMAISAVDIALWDLAARLDDRPLFELLGPSHRSVPVYGSGGFTSLSTTQLVDQLSEWADAGMDKVKMKVATGWGSEPDVDLERAGEVRQALADHVQLFVDANGGYRPKQAARLAQAFADLGVTWFEEPVSSDHLEVLAQLRRRTDLDIAAGEYGYDLAYFHRLLDHEAVDVVQADVSRCGGITEWRRIATLADAAGLQISGHCAQSLHAHVAGSISNLAHIEYFADHARIDRLLFDGVLDPIQGHLHPDPTAPGLGLALADRAESWRIR